MTTITVLARITPAAIAVLVTFEDGAKKMLGPIPAHGPYNMRDSNIGEVLDEITMFERPVTWPSIEIGDTLFREAEVSVPSLIAGSIIRYGESVSSEQALVEA